MNTQQKLEIITALYSGSIDVLTNGSKQTVDIAHEAVRAGMPSVLALETIIHAHAKILKVILDAAKEKVSFEQYETMEVAAINIVMGIIRNEKV